MSFEKIPSPKSDNAEGFEGHLVSASELEPGMHSINHDKVIKSVIPDGTDYRVIFADNTTGTIDRDESWLIKSS